MKSSRRRIAFALSASVPLALPSPAMAVQNWFGYGGIFGPQTNYTFYAPQATNAGFAPQPVTSFSVPAALGEQVIVSTSPVVVPAVSYSPVISYSPATCGSTCGTVCGPTTLVAPPASLAPVIVAPPSTFVPAAPPITTPVYPPPGVYPPGTSVPFPPTRTPEMPTSSTTISPADQPPTLSGFAPIDAAAPMQTPYNAAPINTVPADGASAYTSPLQGGTTTTTPANSAPPSGYTSGGTTTEPNGAKATTPEKSDASEAPRIDRLKPDLDISVPPEDESMTPVKPTEKEQKIDAAPANKPADEADVGPRLDLNDDEHTAMRGMKRAGLLAPATWRAVRPATKRSAAKRTETVWRAAKP